MDISSMLEVQVKVETDVKENVTPRGGQTSSTSVVHLPISQEESNFYKHMFGNDIATVRFRRLHCTACDIHIGSAPAQANNMFEHPVLHTLLCSNCYKFYGDGNFEQGDDATDMFCRWCANGGNLYCCSYCSNTFCYKCIRRNFTPLVRKKIEADEKWKCFVCNPSDLYTMRAICWALLQHVQTVTRILKNDKKMTPEEIEEKMNLDESPCCPRRSKRKRRRMESNSEEEEETFSPKVINGGSITFVKPKVKKTKTVTYTSQMSTNPNGSVKLQSYSNQPFPIRPRPIALLSSHSFNQTEPPKTVADQEERTSSSNNIVVQQHGSSSNIINSNASLPSKYDSNVLQKQTSLYRTTFMKGSNAYMQPSTATNATHKIILSPQAPLQSQSQSSSVSYQPSQSISYQPSQSLQSALNTMVSIPNALSQCRSRILLPKQKESTLIPNIIELDSDSDDEPRVVEQPNVSTANGNNNIIVGPSDKIVPVALAWDDGREEQPLRIIKATQETSVPSLEERMRSHSENLDKLLNDVRDKMQSFLNIDDTTKDNELAAQKKIKEYCCNMRNTVHQLLHINDRVVREYNEWMRSQKKETNEPSSTEINALTSQEKLDISLDMTCVNDSDTESEGEAPQYQIKEPSDIVKNSNIIENLLFCKKDVVHCGVGDDSVQFADKTTQVYDVSRDYENYISHCVMTKADQHSKAGDNVVEAPDKNFGKYEEQFIFYLQHIEDHGTETKETKDFNDSIEILFQETNSLQSFENITSADQPTTSEQETNLRNGVNLVTEDDTPIYIVDNDKQMVDNSSFDIKIKDIYTNILNDILQETESQKVYSNTTGVDAILITSNDDGMSSSKNINDAVNMETAALIGNEEDCTIIDE